MHSFVLFKIFPFPLSKLYFFSLYFSIFFYSYNCYPFFFFSPSLVFFFLNFSLPFSNFFPFIEFYFAIFKFFPIYFWLFFFFFHILSSTFLCSCGFPLKIFYLFFLFFHFSFNFLFSDDFCVVRRKSILNNCTTNLLSRIRCSSRTAPRSSIFFKSALRARTSPAFALVASSCCSSDPEPSIIDVLDGRKKIKNLRILRSSWVRNVRWTKKKHSAIFPHTVRKLIKKENGLNSTKQKQYTSIHPFHPRRRNLETLFYYKKEYYLPQIIGFQK